MNGLTTSAFYQIYPLGLCGAPTENDGVLTPRILRVLDFIPHIQALGIDAVLFNPILQADAHGYDTRDYFTLDCRLGSNEDFSTVCRALHAAGIRVVLDGVFNHVGRGFWAFRDVLERREQSPYRDWFHINFDGNNAYNDGLWYEGWEGCFNLVKLNLKNPQVVEHLFGAVRAWREQFGIDGLRLDVAYCLDRDFLRQLRRFCTQLCPDFTLIGEVLFGNYREIVNPEMLDSCTNYECYKGLYSSLNEHNLFELTYSLNRQFGPESWALYRGLRLMNFVDNHDVTRLASQLRGGQEDALPLAYGLLCAMPGFPCFYYGSEWGARGNKSDGDGALRAAFEKPQWNSLTQYIAELLAVRKGSKALLLGDYKNLCEGNTHCAFRREWEGERVLVAVNIADGPCTLKSADFSGNFTDLITGMPYCQGDTLNLPPRTQLWLSPAK